MYSLCTIEDSVPQRNEFEVRIVYRTKEFSFFLNDGKCANIAHVIFTSP
jgi:hypothetical protein